MTSISPRRTVRTPSILIDWINDGGTSSSATAFREFDPETNEWTSTSYDDMATDAARVASVLREQGATRGSVVSIVVDDPSPFVATFFGVLLAGATPSPIAPPAVFVDTERYDVQLAAMARAAGSSLVVTTAALGERVRAALAADGQHARVVALPSPADLRAADVLVAPDRAGRALVQFTSGSSGTPRPIAVSWDNLDANLAALKGWLRMTPADAVATWLPAYHDMGLIGCMLTPIVQRLDVWSMRPETFVRSPSKWLGCFGGGNATLTALPTFGLRHVVRRAKPDQLEGMDFSGWRAAIVGAERVDAEALRAFAALLAPYGFERRTLVAAYGMAEATLAVTGGDVDSPPVALRVDPASLAMRAPVALRSDEPTDGGSDELIGCGRPHPGLSLRIADEAGTTLADGTLGEICVRGPSVATPLVANENGSRLDGRDDGNELRTGDAGFVLDGELYVIGRMGDSIHIRGKSVYAEELDAALGALDGMPSRRVVLLGHAGDRPAAVVLVEARDASAAWVEPARDIAARFCQGEATVTVATCPRGTIQVTSSGKPRRRVMWLAYTRGELDLVDVGADATLVL